MKRSCGVIFILLLICFVVLARVVVDSTTLNKAQTAGSITMPTSRAWLCGKDISFSNFSHLSKSQDSEDRLLWQRYFLNICNGAYLEMGALDGVRFSNSHWFSHVANWTGVLIEANPHSFELLKQNRPKDILVHSAVCSSDQHVHYIHGSERAVGGIWEFMAPSFRELWHPNIDVLQLPSVRCRPLHDILSESQIHYFDFFSLDVEGAELDVLKTLGSRVRFGVIFVEADGLNPQKDLAVRQLLQHQGYTFDMHQNRSNWFVNADFWKIYSKHIM